MRPIEKLIEKRKEEFIRNNLMSDEFIDFIQKNKKPMDKLLSYYACAIMEVETKFRVLDHQFSIYQFFLQQLIRSRFTELVYKEKRISAGKIYHIRIFKNRLYR